MATTDSHAGVLKLSSRDAEFVDYAPGMEVCRSISAAGLPELGGGWLRMDGTGTSTGTLTMDEVLCVVTGQLEIESDRKSTVARPGEAILVRRGSSITYRSLPNTLVFYVMCPKPSR
jgi:ethanolamine utilization protein EutQ (cupin superfamily)